MSFLPLAANPDRPSRACPAGELSAVVRAAAEELASRLQRAEALTEAWSSPPLTQSLVDATLTQTLFQLAETGCWGEANRLPSNDLWQVAGRWLETGFLQHHARRKPYGYAGDHEMLRRICQQTVCGDPLGQAFDRFFLRQAAPAAVRARTHQIASAIVAEVLDRPDQGCHVLSVGSGPALDVHQGLSALAGERRARVQVTLLDMDPTALADAEGTLKPLLSDGSPAAGAGQSRLRALRTNLARLPTMWDSLGIEATAAGGGWEDSRSGPDILVCSGLFDYLEDRAATTMLAFLWNRLAPGGLLLVGNFSPHNPTRAYMEWIGNWYLTYRTSGDLERIAEAAGLPTRSRRIAVDDTGLDLFVVARKESGRSAGSR